MLSSSVTIALISERLRHTFEGFYGRAYPGDGYTLDAAGEYSVTRNWVLALDVVYQYNANTHLSGTLPPPGATAWLTRAPSGLLGFRPAIEEPISKCRCRALLKAYHQQPDRNHDAVDGLWLSPASTWCWWTPPQDIRTPTQSPGEQPPAEALSWKSH